MHRPLLDVEAEAAEPIAEALLCLENARRILASGREDAIEGPYEDAELASLLGAHAGVMEFLIVSLREYQERWFTSVSKEED